MAGQGHKVIEAKLCLIGETEVGKTCIAVRYLHRYFESDTTTTIGAAYTVKSVHVDGREVRLHIWDTAGAEKFRSMGPMYFRDASAAILVYDITSQKSFDALPNWLVNLSTSAKPNVVLAVAGNKIDKAENDRCVSFTDGRRYAQSVAGIFQEVSAKTNVNIDLLFERLCKQIITASECSEAERVSELNTVNLDEHQSHPRRGCCS